ncbi:MAG TPA: hypothetical protein ACFYEF_00410 [Candidatus Wunengus sp. YC63]|uniref:hypothetical protein n=1 Tax=unclassified Candidatus Wunengus TaxID=3367695 RepID=UPI00402947C9
MGYTRYAWVGNKISDDDMAQLYRLKMKTRRRITEMVAAAVKVYLSQHEQVLNENTNQ